MSLLFQFLILPVPDYINFQCLDNDLVIRNTKMFFKQIIINTYLLTRLRKSLFYALWTWTAPKAEHKRPCLSAKA